MCQCRAPNAPCGVHGRMASVIASLFSRSRPPPPAGLHATTPSVGQTSGATPRCLNPGFSERIGNSRRTCTSDIAESTNAANRGACEPRPMAIATRALPARTATDTARDTSRCPVHGSRRRRFVTPSFPPDSHRLSTSGFLPDIHQPSEARPSTTLEVPPNIGLARRCAPQACGRFQIDPPKPWIQSRAARLSRIWHSRRRRRRVAGGPTRPAPPLRAPRTAPPLRLVRRTTA